MKGRYVAPEFLLRGGGQRGPCPEIKGYIIIFSKLLGGTAPLAPHKRRHLW